MKNQHDTSPDTHDVNPGRRRLTKAGLVAPAVLGVLASRPVLGKEKAKQAPALLTIYKELGRQTVPIALSKGRINSQTAEELSALLR